MPQLKQRPTTSRVSRKRSQSLSIAQAADMVTPSTSAPGLRRNSPLRDWCSQRDDQQVRDSLLAKAQHVRWLSTYAMLPGSPCDTCSGETLLAPRYSITLDLCYQTARFSLQGSKTCCCTSDFGIPMPLFEASKLPPNTTKWVA